MEPTAVTDVAKELPGFIELVKSGGSIANYILIWIAFKIHDKIKSYLDTQEKMHAANTETLKKIQEGLQNVCRSR